MPDTKRLIGREQHLPISDPPDVFLAIARIADACRYNGRVWVVISIRGGSLYRVVQGRYIECGAVDIMADADSSYRIADVDLSVSRPSAGNHLAP